MTAELPLHQHHTIEGAVDCHVADCDVYQIQARAREGVADLPLPEEAITAAAVVFHDAHCGCLTDGHLRSYMDLGRRALEAGTTALRAEGAPAVQARLDQLAECPDCGVEVGPTSDLGELLNLIDQHLATCSP